MQEAEIDTDAPAIEPAKVEVRLLANPTVNHAAYRNNIPFVRSLTPANSSGELLHDVTVTLRCEHERESNRYDVTICSSPAKSDGFLV